MGDLAPQGRKNATSRNDATLDPRQFFQGSV